MDPKLFFWTAALINLGVLCGIALFGVLFARRGEIARHRRAMKIASSLVALFLVSYAVKLLILGRENMAIWTVADVGALRVHEVFVLQMVVAGCVAWIRSRKLLLTKLVTHDPADPVPDSRVVRIHRIAGRTAVTGAVLGFVMAVNVLVGMYLRAPSG
jgi:uncharacterized membrane protein YozB (DUF420 family)